MDIIWGKIKSFFYRPMSEQSRPSPRMADVAMEVLQNLGEEAKDVVYYEALNRVHGVSKYFLFHLKCIFNFLVYSRRYTRTLPQAKRFFTVKLYYTSLILA